MRNVTEVNDMRLEFVLCVLWMAGAGLATVFFNVSTGDLLVVASLAIVWLQLAWIHKAILARRNERREEGHRGAC